ncbi:hypothetical protein M404DRAFT_867242 [Pisolithus tinctorius Marx 270]|uniref:Uncharacterized protein n=1 Tax=Pisolithus tinctorius Marx 270 TaxID=870435 RepID=A0A0C3JJZ9_PISTI|nr:hypothetical protein M404DRAFT_867242 [Pisolithus tinctorius Marx 270]
MAFESETVECLSSRCLHEPDHFPCSVSRRLGAMDINSISSQICCERSASQSYFWRATSVIACTTSVRRY